MLTRSRLLGSILIVTLSALTGCDGFFFKPTTTGTGTGTGPTPAPAGPDYVFVANSGANTIGGMSYAGTVSGFGISSTGALAVLPGSPITFTVSPVTLAVSRDDKFLWVGTQGQIFGFAIAADGTLTALNSGNPLLNSTCADMQTTPDGKWLMVLDSTGRGINLFSINVTTGALTPVQGAGFPALSSILVPKALRIAPSGTFVVAAMGTAGELLFNFNTATGAFTAIGTPAAPPGTSSDNGIAIDPTSSYLYIARSGTAAGLIVNTIGSNGSLTPTTTTPYTVGGQPYAVALDPAGKYAYVANRSDGTISAFTIGAGAALTAVPGAAAMAGGAVQSLGTDNSGKWLLAAAYSGAPDLTLFGFDSTTPGRLTMVTSTPTGTNASVVALSH